ncbi:Na+/H+ antiporter NhaA [Candidatus Thorarchaeota archaeon]|nr:MAG: Na+/H+ antiporter NhaA [Candidatus Thorarchaeota archaeon]
MQDRLKRFKKGKPVHPVLHRTIRPFREFMRVEASGGIIVVVCLIIALLWVNLPFGATYDMFWGMHLSLSIGSLTIDEPLGFWVNDLLMAIFFFLIGLEIKRELLIGWLNSFEQAILPVVAAIGAMIVPALIYSLFNPPGSPGSVGWAIPMATDIAICLGILNLFGDKIPTATKVFLTTLAIVDDLAGIMVIAIFYSHGLHIEYLVLSALLVVALIILNRLGIRKLVPYLLIGLTLWTAMLFGGIHPTLAGVLLAVSIPATTKIDYDEFKEINDQLQTRLIKIVDCEPEDVDTRLFMNTTNTLEQACRDVEAPLQRTEIILTPWVAFLIVPLFVLANAGVRLEINIIELFSQPVTLGIIFGLVLGKPIGVLSSIWLIEKISRIRVSDACNRDLLVGVAFLTGIGFTISLFISGLSFAPGILLEAAKTGILIAAVISGVLAVFALRSAISKIESEKKKELAMIISAHPT